MDVYPNVLRYFARSILKPLANDASSEQADRLVGEIWSDGQVHVPVRMLVRRWRGTRSDRRRSRSGEDVGKQLRSVPTLDLSFFLFS
jgi:hypothetical protein